MKLLEIKSFNNKKFKTHSNSATKLSKVNLKVTFFIVGLAYPNRVSHKIVAFEKLEIQKKLLMKNMTESYLLFRKLGHSSIFYS